MELRVWWIRNPPRAAQYISVSSVEEAQTEYIRLARADLKDKRVHDNAGGLESFDGREWTEYYNDNGDDITDLTREML